jgi:hypothetical protein
MKQWKILVFREVVQQIELHFTDDTEDGAWERARHHIDTNVKDDQWEQVDDELAKENVAYIIMREDK